MKTNAKINGVAHVLSLAKNEQELGALLHDLFTESELNKAHERIKIFAALHEGKSQRETKKESGAAIATVTHGARFLKQSALIIQSILESARKATWWNRLIWRA